MTCFEPRTKNHAFFKLLGMAATFWSAAVFRRFWGKRECPSALHYDADLRAAEHPPSPSRLHSKLGCAMGYGVAGRRTPKRKRNQALPNDALRNFVKNQHQFFTSSPAPRITPAFSNSSG